MFQQSDQIQGSENEILKKLQQMSNRPLYHHNSVEPPRISTSSEVAGQLTFLHEM